MWSIGVISPFEHHIIGCLVFILKFDLYCNNRATPKCKFLLWIAAHYRVPTKDWLLKWGLAIDKGCVMCDEVEEIIDHIFL